MQKTIILNTFFLCLAGLIIMTIVYLTDQPVPPRSPLSVSTKASSSSLSSPTVGTSASTRYTAAQVGNHGISSDCWLIILNRVYNVTLFLNTHPGGASSIIPYCGKDATAAFQTHGQPGGSNHSAYAYSLLSTYYLGDIAL